MLDGTKKELKNFDAASRFSRGFLGQVAKDVDAAKVAATVAANGATSGPLYLGELQKSLAKLEYIFRGTVPADVVSKLPGAIQAALDPAEKTLWTAVKIIPLSRSVLF